MSCALPARAERDAQTPLAQTRDSSCTRTAQPWATRVGRRLLAVVLTDGRQLAAESSCDENRSRLQRLGASPIPKVRKRLRFERLETVRPVDEQFLGMSCERPFSIGCGSR